MLDLQPIKDRLAAATPGPWNDDKTQLVLNAPQDLAALVAEVERLRGDVQRYRSRIEQHKFATALYGRPNAPDNKALWEVLNA